MLDINHTLVYYYHRHKAEKNGRYFNVNTPKTDTSNRQVPMMKFVKEAFRMEKEYQEAIGMKREVVVDRYADFIFVNCIGGVQHQGMRNKAIRRITRGCNDEILPKGGENPVLLPHFSCHILQHTFTTRMCEAGVNVKVIQDTLGHSDISTTLNIYADVTQKLKLAEISRLDPYFKKMTKQHIAYWSHYATAYDSACIAYAGVCRAMFQALFLKAGFIGICRKK